MKWRILQVVLIALLLAQVGSVAARPNMTTINWSGYNWYVNTCNASAVVKRGVLKLQVNGYDSVCGDRARVDVISVDVFTQNAQYYTRHKGATHVPGVLAAPLWTAQTSDPWTPDGEMDIESFYPATFRNVVWNENATPPFEFPGDTVFLHEWPYPSGRTSLVTEVIWWRPSVNWVRFETWRQPPGEWELLSRVAHQSTHVPDANENIHMWISLYAYPAVGSKTLKMDVTEFGVVPTY